MFYGIESYNTCSKCIDTGPQSFVVLFGDLTGKFSDPSFRSPRGTALREMTRFQPSLIHIELAMSVKALAFYGNLLLLLVRCLFDRFSISYFAENYA